MKSIRPIIDRLQKVLNPVHHNENPSDFFPDDHMNSLLWGSYRPQVYLGMRTRSINDSLVAGVLWTPKLRLLPFRHFTKTEDNINFQWNAHNGRDFGVQSIVDGKLKMKSSFVRYEGPHGGDWVMRIQSSSKQDNVSLITYLGIENIENAHLNIHTFKKHDLVYYCIQGYTEKTKDFILYLSNSDEAMSYAGVKINEPWRIEAHLSSHVKEKSPGVLSFLNRDTEDRSTYAIISNLNAPFIKDIVFVSNVQQRFGSNVKALTYIDEMLSNYKDQLSQREQKFDQQIENIFQLKQKGLTNQQEHFGKILLSNLLGGVGYFQGRNRIYDVLDGQEVWKYSKNYNVLTTATPSRPYFPRGFMWDEGFHQLLISRFDSSLGKDIFYHWFNLMNENGWIPREQILGTEAESRVPPEFVIQYPDHANPPTLLFPLEVLLNNGNTSDSFLQIAYDQLANQFLWFERTQFGPTTNTFRWRGSVGNHTLASGLDDYPRAMIRSDKEENMDLLCWMIFSSQMLSDLGSKLNRREAILFENIHHTLNDTLHKIYWSDVHKGYFDYDGLNNQFINHTGYISLFPVIFGLISPNSERLAYSLDMIEALKSPFGLASLSKNDPLFGTQEDYWRGPIWINLNYLVLRSLYKNYAFVEGPYQQRALQIYNSLRNSIIDNTFNVYTKQHSFFENYCPLTGKGRGQRPFAGWTSLVVLIMGEIY